MTAPLPAGLALVAAAALAVAGFAGAAVVAGAAGLCVLALAVGWGDLLRLPHRPGTSALILVIGLIGIIAATAAVVSQFNVQQPLAVFASVMAIAVLSSFAHELARRDDRHDLVESVTGTLAGQFIAVLAAGWVLVGGTDTGSSAVAVAVAGVAAARLALVLPVTRIVITWIAIAVGPVASVGVAVVLGGVGPITAASVGLAVSGVGVAVDRLVDSESLTARLQPATLARAAAPVAAAGTAAYAVLRMGIG